MANSNDDQDLQVTPEALYAARRRFLKTSIYAASGLATYGLYRAFRPSQSISAEDAVIAPNDNLTPAPADRVAARPSAPEAKLAAAPSTPLKLTAFEAITGYNNYYEFSTDKEQVASAASDWKFNDWSVNVGGLVERPFNLNLKDLQALPNEKRIYRFRCVEGWSMVIPWQGFPLARLLERARPTSQAKYVAFETFFDAKAMPRAAFAGIEFPYVEGLRLDEALHPLTLMATGLYGKSLLNQNGAPIRLVVPWKYGFKSIKSVVKITLVEKVPPTTWNIANPREYGFYSNVNPSVDHPRWSQKRERRIGEFGLRETLPFNGYARDVESLYAGMDLRTNF